MTDALCDGHLAPFMHTRGLYCDLHVSSEASLGCEVGAPYEAPLARSFDPLYITVPLGFSVPAMSMQCPDGLVCVDHPGTIDLSRLEPLYPQLTAAELTADLKTMPTSGPDNFVATLDEGRPE